MPRVYAARRPHIGYREDTATLTALDQLAAARGVDRSDILRAATAAYLTAQQRPEAVRWVALDPPVTAGAGDSVSFKLRDLTSPVESADLVAEPHVDAP